MSNSHQQLFDIVSERANYIATSLFGLAQSSVAAEEPVLLVLTVEFDSELYYGPVSNIDLSTLREVVGAESAAVTLERIRNDFPISASGPHIVGAVLKAAFATEDAHGVSVYVQLDETGKATGLKCFNELCEVVDVPQQIETAVMSYGAVSQEVNASLTSMRDKLAPGKDRFLVLRSDLNLDGDGVGRRTRLAQIGVVFCSDAADNVPADVLTTVRSAMTMSSFAALTLFYEKERYFHKALRQSMKGSIVKTEPSKSVRSQVDRLKRLRERGELMVPEVIKHDEEISEKLDDDPSWYLMTRYELMPLMDLFTQTPGLQDYEVRTLSRSAFRHVREVYWGRDVDGQRVRTIPSILATAALAKDMVEGCIDGIKNKGAAVRDLTPVRLRRGYGVFPPASLKRFTPLMKFLEEPESEEFSVSVAWDSHVDIQTCRSPATVLDEIMQSLCDSNVPEHFMRATIHEGELHGDSHFANLLVDASVPEDPLIVSIDQTGVSYDDKERAKAWYEFVPKQAAFNDFHQELQCIERDPSYDVAKLMLASSCCYGLMYRHAFDVDLDDAPFGAKLSRAKAQSIKGLSSAGGISGADVLAVILPVPEEAYRYHQIGAKVLCTEFVTFLESGVVNDTADVNVGLTRLWFLTVRHVFSISSILFPQDPDAATCLFLWGTKFVSEGQQAFNELLKQNFQSDPLAFAHKAFGIMSVR